MINHNLADVHQPACAQAVHSLTPASSLIQTILSVSESHRIGRHRGSRTIPPVGNFALPRRTYLSISILSSIFAVNRVWQEKYAHKKQVMGCQVPVAPVWHRPKRSVELSASGACLTPTEAERRPNPGSMPIAG